MAEPNSNNDLEEFRKLWQLLNTPIGDLNNQPSLGSDSSAKATDASQSSAKYRRKLGGKASADSGNKSASTGKTYMGNFRARGFSKRHSANQNPNPNRKQHNFRDTTKRIGLQSDESTPIGLEDTRWRKDGKSLYKPGFFTLVFGVFLPLAAMVVESSTHYLAQTMLDPFPTPNHLFLFSLIPISNFLNWLSARINLSPLYSVIALGTGMALGIAILYSVMLLPLTLNFALLPGGSGLLGLAPLLSIPITLMCGHTICQLADRQKTFFDAHQLKHLGHLIILVMVLVVELPSTLTRWHLSKADEGDQQAIQWLRQWGSQDVLLRACYERSGEPTDILGTLAEQHHPVSVDNARYIFYRVTGVSFNSVPIPASFRGTIKHAGLIDDPLGLNDGVKDEFDLDPDIAGELVSGVARGLSVSDSSISGSLDSSNGVASLDWNFTFENVSTIPREARAKILLPPNAVVTKATLWLDDLQRETVIQERDLARNTYVQSVASHKRDPLLVSMAGKDSVLVQCYPVVKGTKTKIRLHIVAPLVVSTKAEESLVMPTFEERNFAITIPHKIDLTSTSDISLNGTGSVANGKLNQLKRELDNSVMSRFEAVARVGVTQNPAADSLTIRPPQTVAEIHREFFSLLPEASISPMVQALSQNIGSRQNRSLTVIVDKSVTMSPYVADIVNGLKAAPKALPITIMEVKDGNNTLCTAAHSDQDTFQTALKTLSESKCEGGQFDGYLLTDVLESSLRAPTSNRTDVLWIHAAQPIANHSVDKLRNLMNYNYPGAPALYDLQVASGPNAVLPESYDYPKLNRIVRTGALSRDISTFIENYANNKIRRSATTFAVRSAGTTSGASSDLAQVQAYKLAMGRYQAGDKWGAYELASRYHLVTPVSSAVVTEDAPVVADKNEFAVEKSAELEETTVVDQIAQAPPPPQPLAPPKAGLAQTKQLSLKNKGNFKKLDKTRFYNAPKQMQILDSRPVISDFRAASGKSVSDAKSDQFEGGSFADQAGMDKVMSAPAEEKYSFERKAKESSISKDRGAGASVGALVGGRGGSGYYSNGDEAGESSFASNTESLNRRSDAPVSPPAISSGAWSSSRINASRQRSRALPSRALGQASPYPQSAPILNGATNGTVGPQYDNSVVYGGRDTYGGEKKQEYSYQPQDSEKQTFSAAATSPFSGITEKLSSLSKAAGSMAAGSSADTIAESRAYSAGAPAAMDYDPDHSAAGSDSGSSQYGNFLSDSSRETEQMKPGFVDGKPNKSGIEALIMVIGIAIIVMLSIFFRLLAKMSSADKTNSKGPIQ